MLNNLVSLVKSFFTGGKPLVDQINEIITEEKVEEPVKPKAPRKPRTKKIEV